MKRCCLALLVLGSLTYLGLMPNMPGAFAQSTPIVPPQQAFQPAEQPNQLRMRCKKAKNSWPKDVGLRR